MLPLFVEIKLRKSKIKTITVSDEVMDNLENAFKKLRKEVIENEKKKGKYYIFFTNEQLKKFFGFTDKELKTKTKKLKKETLVVDI